MHSAVAPPQWGSPFLWCWLRQVGLWPSACVAPSGALDPLGSLPSGPASRLGGLGDSQPPVAQVPGGEEQVGNESPGMVGELGALEAGPTGPAHLWQGKHYQVTCL